MARGDKHFHDVLRPVHSDRRVKMNRWSRRNSKTLFCGDGTPYANPFTTEMMIPSVSTYRRKSDNNIRYTVNVDERRLQFYQRWIRGLVFEKTSWLTDEALNQWRKFIFMRYRLIDALPLLYAHLDAGGRLGCMCKLTDSCHADVLAALWWERWNPETKEEVA